MTDADAILQALTETERSCLDGIEVFAEIGSTNSYLMEQPGPGPGRFRVAVAEHQTAGRGRDGKTWVAPPSSGLCLSLSYTFVETPVHLPGLTLAVGVGIAAALQIIGVDDIALKWPNDIVAHDGKLGGILTEVQSRGAKGTTVVVGLGLNVDLPRAMHYEAPAKWTTKVSDLKECVDILPSRAALTAGILQCLFGSIARFEIDGFATFRSAWQSYDWLKGKAVSTTQPGGHVSGVADGIDSDGALLVKTADGTMRIVTGSVAVSNPTVACA